MGDPRSSSRIQRSMPLHRVRRSEADIVIDLGSELADFDDDPKAPRSGMVAPAFDPDNALGDLTDVLANTPFSSGYTVPLADLQRQGFNTTPPGDLQ